MSVIEEGSAVGPETGKAPIMSAAPAEKQPAAGMDRDHLAALIATEQTYWWHVAKRALVLGLLKQHAPTPGLLVEGGIGGGSNLLAARNLGYDVIGYDLMPESVAHAESLGLESVRVHDLEIPWPVAPGSARAALLLDVIEHLRDPVAALRHAGKALADDGALIVTVPAIPSLYGPWDRMLGHERRYSPRLLRMHAEEAGLKVRRLSHWNAFTLPAAWPIRWLERWRKGRRSAEFPPVSSPMNSLLKGFAGVERAWLLRWPSPLGLSLFGVLGR